MTDEEIKQAIIQLGARIAAEHGPHPVACMLAAILMAWEIPAIYDALHDASHKVIRTAEEIQNQPRPHDN